jgi:hypothetical protein
MNSYNLATTLPFYKRIKLDTYLELRERKIAVGGV